MSRALAAAIAVLAAVAFGQQDVLIHEGRADFTVAEYFLDGEVVVEVMNCPPWEEFLYETTDHGQTWENLGGGGSSDTALTKVCSFAADGECAYYYALSDGEFEIPNTLVLYQYDRDGAHHWFENIAPFDINAHEFAGTTDHLGAGHWIYICVVDTDPPVPEQTLMFLRDTLYGDEWFPPVDSFPLRVRDPHLATGAGRHVYFAGRAGADGDSLIIWTNRNRLEPGNWVFNWIDTGGDEIESPLVAAAFTPEDSTAVVWCAYSRNRDNSGNWDIEFVYSLDGGISWSEPQVLAGLVQAQERYLDLASWRGPGAEEVSIAYVNSYQSENTIYWRKASAAEPTQWSEPVRMNRMNAALGRNVRPKLCYLAGVSPVTAGVVYNAADGSGVWWGSPFIGAVAEAEQGKGSVRLEARPSLGPGPFRLRAEAGIAVLVQDICGRVVREVRAGATGQAEWDGRDRTGTRVPAGVYFIRPEPTSELARVVVTR